MADPELAAVEAALNTLALAETEAALQKVITRLLPALLTALSTPSTAARAKCIETLQHINVRLRALPNPSLPFSAVLSAATVPTAAPLTSNVAIQGGYLAKCFHTLSRSARADALPALLAPAPSATPPNAAVLHSLALHALAAAAAEHPPSAAAAALWQPISALPEQAVLAFFRHGLDALRRKLKVTPPAPELHLLALLRLASEYAATDDPTRAARVFPHLLVAAGTPSRTALSTTADSALKKLPAADALAAADPSLAATLFDLFADPLAEIPLRITLLSRGLLRVPLAASCFPEVLDVMSVSLTTPGIPARFQALGMQFVSFVITYSEDGALEANAAPVAALMMRLVRNETEGSPSFPGKVRAFGYTGLAEMVVRVPSLMGKHGLTAALFFDAAQARGLPAEVRSAAAHALITLTRVVRVDRHDQSDIRKVILSTLFQAVANEHDVATSARAAAVQWANECFSFADCDARLVNIIASADIRQDVRQHAAFGLSRKRWVRKEKTAGESDEMVKESSAFPKFSEIVETFSKHNGPAMRPKSIIAYLNFALSVLRHAVVGTGNVDVLRGDILATFFDAHPPELNSLRGLKSISDQVLISDSPGNEPGLQRAALCVILFASQVKTIRKEISETYADRVEALSSLTEKNSAAGDTSVARALSVLIGIGSEGLPKDRLLATVGRIGEGLEPNPSGVASGRYGEDQRVAKVLTLGQILARCSHRQDVMFADLETSPLSALCLQITRRVTLAVESSDVVRIAACTALADIGVNGPLPIPLSSRAVAVNTLSGVLKLHSSSARLAESAADAIGKICVGEPRRSFKRTAVDALVNVCRERKEDEIRFTAAESLVRCASGFDAPPPTIADEEASSASPSGRSTESEDLKSILEMKSDPFEIREAFIDDEDIDVGPSTIQEVVRAAVHLSRDERPNARAGGCVCLFTFLRLLGSKDSGKQSSEERVAFVTPADKSRFHERQRALADMLPEIQQAFTILLGDRSDFVQQLASCGVALVYDMCPPKEQRELVSTLVRSLTAGKTRAASTVPGDQGSLLEMGGVNAAEPLTGGRSATYKELCTLAQDMGQPELVYKFMDLAGHTALWNNRRGAALAGSALLDNDIAAEQLRPHVKTLLPRLYVYCFDPTESVRIAMGSVLSAVVKASGTGTVAEAISQNYESVTQYCLKSMTSRQWRNREAACGALRDALVSRTWDQVKDLLAEFWYITLRALDDIKESVRKAAGGTGRALSELSVHLCDPGQVGLDVASSAISVVIPSVLPAFTHAVAEVRVLATKTLTDVIRLGGSSLISSVPDLVEALLEAATELEPQVLNYAEFHVEAKEELQNARVDAASMSASPLIDSLERLSGHVDESIIEKLIPKLTRLSRIGIGIPTRAATARFFSTLLRSRAVIVEPYASRLMFAAVAAAGMERNLTLRGLWCTAVGAAAKLSGTEDVGKLVERIVEYSGSEDAQERSLASSLAVGLWRKSPDTARQHASAMLPIAYMGRYESDEDAKNAGSNWKEVWSEGAPSTEAGLRLYAREITDICEKRLATSSQYRVKRSAAAALGALAGASNESVDVSYLGQAAKALLTALPGHIWDGKVVALEALGIIASSYSNLDVWEGTGGADGVVRTLLQESKRGKKDYRLAAIASAAKLLNKCHDQFDLFEEVRENLVELWSFDQDVDASVGDGSTSASRLVWETGTDADAVNARNKARKARKALCIAAVTCLEAAYASEKVSEHQARHIDSLVGTLESLVKGDWEVRLGVLQALKRAVARSDNGVLISGVVTDTQSVLSRILRMAETGVTDTKYAAIRRCGLAILLSLGEQVTEISAVQCCFPTTLVEVVLSIRQSDADSATQGEAKKVCTLFDLQKT